MKNAAGRGLDDTAAFFRYSSMVRRHTVFRTALPVKSTVAEKKRAGGRTKFSGRDTIKTR
ncbi:hypothetical protein [Sutterella megalosphaeroides]|uniref:hypothetical protein n=1 Tax=Sutterella megalosphaeroides TaxID=2494234 RepID=UPI000F4F169C|nr:hypothetical protein [Sutterella megalosphaeroides]